MMNLFDRAEKRRPTRKSCYIVALAGLSAVTIAFTYSSLRSLLKKPYVLEDFALKQHVPFEYGTSIDENVYQEWLIERRQNLTEDLEALRKRPNKELLVCLTTKDGMPIEYEELERNLRGEGYNTLRFCNRGSSCQFFKSILDNGLYWESCNFLFIKAFKKAQWLNVYESGEQKIMEREMRRQHTVIQEIAYFRESTPTWNPQDYLSFVWDGLNGNAILPCKQMPAERWNEHFANRIDISPWREPGVGDYYLLAGQKPADANVYPLVRRFGSMDAFYDYVVDGIRNVDPSAEIRFKGHPDMRGTKYYVPPGLRDITYQDANEALKDCKVLVIGTSLLGLTAMLRGIPVIALDPEASVWEVAGHRIEEVVDPPRPPREPLLHNLAYTMWSKSEIENGEMFNFMINPENFAACPAGSAS